MKKSRSIVITLGIALLMISLAAFISSESAEVHAATGYGTEASPYLIESEADWNEFAQNVSNGNSYSGRIIKLTNDITVSRMAGDSDDVFSGTFDGDGHTLTFNYKDGENYIAPFRYVSGAVISNLTVSGNIDTWAKFAGGFIGKTTGNVMLIGCRSSINIKASIRGDGTHGGFIAEARGSNTTFINCLFDGAISGDRTSKCGGFIGWAENGGVYIFDSLFAGSMSTNTDECATFARGNGIGSGSFINAWYTSAYGEEQGTQTDKTGEELQEQLGEGWTVSGENVIPKKADLISGDGTSTSPYLIKNKLNWMEFAHRVKSGNNYRGKTLKLTNDISVDSMVGDADHRFCGTFDGNGHTITFNLKTGEKHAAPFRFVSGAAFYNLIVNGSIETSNQCAAGIVGNSTGEVAFVSCRSSIDLICSKNGNATHGGFIAEAQGPLTIFKDCLFDGSISGDQTTSCSSFVGWPADNCKLSFINCLSDGQYSTKKDGDTFVDCGTFTRENPNGTITVKNSYYKTAYGATQGTLTDKTGNDLKSELGAGWTTDGNDVVPGNDAMGGLEGKGTVDSPYLIKNELDWEFLARSVNNGDRFGGQVFRLTKDIVISQETTIAPMIGNTNNPFGGVFDGDGHKITFNYNTNENYAAPFRCVENASIYNLTVDGTIETSAKIASGFISRAKGDVTLVSCRSSINIDSSVVGNSTSGGFIAETTNATDKYFEFTDCLFDGTISGSQTTDCGGFIGWLGNGNTAVFNNCLNEGTFSTAKNDSQEFTGCATFSRVNSSDKIKVTNSYYRTAYGTVQGEQTDETGNELKGMLGDGWTIDGDKVVPKNVDIQTLGLNGIGDYDIVRFSGIDWVVLDADRTNGYATEEEYEAGGRKSPGMFLISKGVYGNTHYAANEGASYEGSNVQNMCTGFYNNNIKDSCKSAIIGVKTKEDTSQQIDGLDGCNINGLRSNENNTDKVFLLSAWEYSRYNESITGSVRIPATRGGWWLRSVMWHKDSAGYVYGDLHEGQLDHYFIGELYPAALRLATNIKPDKLICLENPGYIAGSQEPKWILKTYEEAIDDDKKDLQAAIDKAEKKRDYVAIGYTNESKQAVTNAVSEAVDCIETDHTADSVEETEAVLAEIAAKKTAVEKAAAELTVENYDVSGSEYTIKAGDEISADGIDLSVSDAAGKGYFGNPMFRVLKVEDGRMLLMSEYLWGGGKDSASSGTMRFDSNGSSAWQGSDAQAWGSAFNDDILSQITGLKVNSVPDSKTDKEYSPAADQIDGDFSFGESENILTKDDKVFCLSGEEALEFMKGKDQRIAKVYDEDGAGDEAAWWLRSPVKDSADASGITKDGSSGLKAANKGCYMRPVFWADMNDIDADTISRSEKDVEGTARTVYTIKPVPHEHDWGEISYEWSDDNSTVTATRVCKTDPKHVEEETVETTSEVETPATCENKGTTKYTAEFENEAFETQTETVEDIDAIGHDYRYVGMTWNKVDEAVSNEQTGEESAGGYAVTANFVCWNDGEHKKDIDAVVTSETADSTCQKTGIITYTATATFDGKEYTDTKTDGIEVKAHNWGTATYTWAKDGSVCAAKRACANEGCDAEETETATVTSNVKTAAACETKGTTTYTASFENAGFKPQTKDVEDIPALGHEWGAPTYTWAKDNSSVTARRVCSHDSEHVETEMAETTSKVTKEATEEAEGEMTYTASFSNAGFTKQTNTAVIPKAKHVHALEKTEAKASTCTEAGNIAYWTCSKCKKLFSDEGGTREITKEDTIVKALGHAYSFTGMTWKKAESGSGYTASANFVCANDRNHTETVTAKISSESVDSTCQKTGIITYTATATFDGVEYTDTKSDGIEVKAHNWSAPEYTWSNDGSICVAKRSCENEGCSAAETEMAVATSEVMVPATYEAKGTTRYTAAFENEAFKAQTEDIKDIPVKERDPAAKTALDKINGLPEIEEITTADKTAIERARKVYDNLTEEEKKSLPAGTLEKLQKAETALEEAQRIAEEEATKKEAESAAAKKKAADARANTVKTVTVNVKTVNAKAINKAVKKAGGSSKYVTKIVLGKKVRKISKGAFKSYKNVKTLEVKTKKLTKKTVKRSLKGSKITKVKVKVGKKKTNKKYIKNYRKIFTKKNCGRKVSVR